MSHLLLLVNSTSTVTELATVKLRVSAGVRAMHFSVEVMFEHLLALQGPWVGEYAGVSTYPLPQAGQA